MSRAPHAIGSDAPGFDARRRVAALEADVERLREGLALVLRLLEGHAARTAAGAPMPERLPLATAARRLGISPATLRRWVQAGVLPGIAVQAGGRRRWAVDRAAVEELERRGARGARERRARR